MGSLGVSGWDVLSPILLSDRVVMLVMMLLMMMMMEMIRCNKGG